MRTGFTISAVAHAAVLAWAMVSFGARPFAVHTETMPIDIVSASELSQYNAGSKTAKPAEKPKPVVEKTGDPKPIDDPEAKVTEKKEIARAAEPAAVPEPEPKPEPKPKQAEQKPAPKPEPKPEPKEAKQKPEAKPDKIAEILKKEEASKPEPKKQAAKAPMPPKRPPVRQKPQPRFNPDRIAALLDKREPQRHAATGQTLNANASLGTRTGTAAQLSQNEIDALRARIQQCWNPPAGASEAKDLVVQVRIQFNQDGSLAGEPRLLTHSATTFQQIAAESALRAIRRCAPYTFLPPSKYEAWKDVEVTFDPRDMFRG